MSRPALAPRCAPESRRRRPAPGRTCRSPTDRRPPVRPPPAAGRDRPAGRAPGRRTRPRPPPGRRGAPGRDRPWPTAATAPRRERDPAPGSPARADQLRAGVHSELPRQHRPHLAEGPERLGLATGLVLGPSQQGPASFAQGLGADRALRSVRTPRAHPPGARRPGGAPRRPVAGPPGVPPRSAHGPSRPGPAVVPRATGRAPRPGGTRRGPPPQLQELPGTLDEALEAPGVELLVSDREPVALGNSLDGPRSEAACAAA